MTVSVDPATNHILGRSYDANGNLLTLPTGDTGQYDAENRLMAVPGIQYGYDAANKRIWKWTGTKDSNSNPTGIELSFYGIEGRRLGIYVTSVGYANLYNNGYPQFNVPVIMNPPAGLLVYFGGKLVGNGLPGSMSAFVQDRLGSGVKTFPYGEEKVATGWDGLKFATYARDTATNLDYADQRYYSSSLGRFMTPDPYAASAKGAWEIRSTIVIPVALAPSGPMMATRGVVSVSVSISKRPRILLLARPKANHAARTQSGRTNCAC
jgi:RHS repeat-associated protein